MAERSHVTSFEAIESFRANLIVFLGKARPTVEEVSNELLRMRTWLETDQRNHWEKQIRLLGLQLEQAQQELFAARLSKLQSASAVQEMAVHRCRRRLQDAEDKLQMTRKWSRAFEDQAHILAKEVESLHSFLMVDMVGAVAHLEQVVKSLEAYADVPQPGFSTGNAPAPVESPPTPSANVGAPPASPGKRR